MVKRFIVAFFTFIGLIIPAAFALAFMAAPARPQRLLDADVETINYAIAASCSRSGQPAKDSDRGFHTFA